MFHNTLANMLLPYTTHTYIRPAKTSDINLTLHTRAMLTTSYCEGNSTPEIYDRASDR